MKIYGIEGEFGKGKTRIRKKEKLTGYYTRTVCNCMKCKYARIKQEFSLLKTTDTTN